MWKDKLLSYNGKPITYDAIGNPLSYDGYTYTWEVGIQLKSIVGNSKNISFKYNDAGIRTEKNVDGVITKYYLLDSKVTYETKGTDVINYTYDGSGNLVSMNLNGVEYYYIRNAQGDIVGLFDKNGVQVVNYIYDSWGKLILTSGTLGATVGVKNPFRYRGYRFDTETGLYYLNSRYYNPEWGRFINADGYIGKQRELLSLNMFAYCRNNPVNMIDSNGYDGILGITIMGILATAAETTLAIVASPLFLIGVSVLIFGYGGYKLYQYYKDDNMAYSSVNKGNEAIGLQRSKKAKLTEKSFPSQKAARRAAFRDSGIGKHGHFEKIDEPLNKGSKHPFKGEHQTREGWLSESGNEVVHDLWGHKGNTFAMPHYGLYPKGGGETRYYYPTKWDPRSNI